MNKGIYLNWYFFFGDSFASSVHFVHCIQPKKVSQIDFFLFKKKKTFNMGFKIFFSRKMIRDSCILLSAPIMHAPQSVL